MHDLSFLFRTDATSENNVGAFAQIDEFFYKFWVLLNCGKAFTSDDYRIVTRLFRQILLSFEFD